MVASPVFLCSSHLDADIVEFRNLKKKKKSFKQISQLFEKHKTYEIITYLQSKSLLMIKIVFIKLFLFMH